MSTLAASDHQLEAVAAAHRQNLRRILQIKHTVSVTNTDLYVHVQSLNILIDLINQRMKLLDHILLSGNNTPAYKSMLTYPGNPTCKPVCKGKTTTTLPVLLDRDLRYAHRRLWTTTDLLHVTALAANQSYWTAITTAIITKKYLHINYNEKPRKQTPKLASQRIASQREATIIQMETNK